MKPGGVGASMTTTPFWFGSVTSSPVDSSMILTSKPYIGSPGLPKRLGSGSTPLARARIGQPLSVCQ